MKNIIIILGVVAIVGGGVWFLLNRDVNEELTAEEAATGDEEDVDYEKTEVLFECEEGQLAVDFYNSEEDYYAEIKLSNGQVINVHQAVSASGARYQSEDEVFNFHTKGEEAFLEENGETIYSNCINVDSDPETGADSEKEFRESGNLMINNPGMKEEEWYLSYEEKGNPGLEKMIDFDKEHVNCLAEEDTCSKFFSKDDSLQGSRVEILGEEKGDEVSLLEIEFLKN